MSSFFGKIAEKGSGSLVTALNEQIESMKPDIKHALNQVEQTRLDLNAHVSTFTEDMIPKIDKLSDTVTTRLDVSATKLETDMSDLKNTLVRNIGGVTDRVNGILETVGGLFKSSVKTGGIVTQIMEILTSVASIAAYVENNSPLYGVTALWSIWKVIKISLDLFPSIKDMDMWKETANASFEIVPDSILREQAGNGLFTGLGFAAIVTNFMPKWVIKTLELFSRGSRYRILEDLTWVGDALGIVLEVPAFIMNWVADNFADVVKVSMLAQERFSGLKDKSVNEETEHSVWDRFNRILADSNIPEKLREFAKEYQGIIGRLPGTKLHRLTREAEALIIEMMDDYRKLAEDNVGRKLKEVIDQMNMCMTKSMMDEGRIPESVKETYRKISDLYRVSVSLSLQIRQVPVMVVLQGMPKCGKSYLLSQALARLRTKNGIYPYVNNNPTKDYNDLYAGQSIWVHEEIGRKGGSDYAPYVSHVSVMPSPLDAAELTRKQLLTFQSKLILGTTNDNILGKQIQFLTTDFCKEPEAVYRRIFVVDCDQFKYDSKADKYVPLNRGDGLMHYFEYNTDERRYIELRNTASDPNDIGAFIEVLNDLVSNEARKFEVAIEKSKKVLDVDIVDFNLRPQGLQQIKTKIGSLFGKKHMVDGGVHVRDLLTSDGVVYLNGELITEKEKDSTVNEILEQHGGIHISSGVDYVDYMKDQISGVLEGISGVLTSLFDKLKDVWMSLWDKFVDSKPRVLHNIGDEIVSPYFTYVKFVEVTGVEYKVESEQLTMQGKSATLKVPYGSKIKDLLGTVSEIFKTEVFVSPTIYNMVVGSQCSCCKKEYRGLIIQCTTEGHALQKIWKWFMNSFLSHPLVLSSIFLTLATIGMHYLTRKYKAQEYRSYSKVNFPRPPVAHRRYNLRPQSGGEKLQVLMNNTLRAVVSTHGQTITATIVMLDSVHALLPAHCLVNADSTVCMDPFISGENRQGRQLFKHWFQVLELDLFEDYALLEIKERTAHIFPDIKDRFVQAIQSTKCVLIAGKDVVDISTPSKGDINSPYFTFNHNGKAVVTAVDQGFVYEYQQDGICGALVSTIEGQVIGWHVATDDVYGFARPFKNHLLEVIGSMKKVQQTIGIINGTYMGAIPIATTGYRNVQKSSRIVPSKMQNGMAKHGLTDNNGNVERVPASLDDPDGVDVYTRGREKSLMPGKPVDREALDFATAYMKNMLIEVTNGKKLDILSEREIVCGRDRNTKTTSSTLRRVEPASSSGIPWNGQNRDYLDYENGKISREIQSKMDWIEKSAKSGVRVENEIIFKDCWKDELRLFEKQFKPRIFAAGPLHYTLLLRKYFGHLSELFMDKRLETGVMIGINAVSKEWDVLCKKLKMLPNIFSGDYKMWDGAMVKEFQILLNKLLSELTHAPLLTETLLSYLYETQREGKGDAYLTTHSIPSGHGLTALYNSLINKMYIAYAWYLAVGKEMAGSITQLIIAFKKDVYGVVYGDDLLVTVADRIKDKFNAVVYARTMDDIGLGFTTASKEKVIFPFERMEDVTFLKRYFVFNNKTKTVTGPLEPLILRSTIGWVNDPTLDEQLVNAKMDNIQRECFLSLDGDFLWGQMLNLYKETYGVDYHGLTEREMMDLYNRGELESDYSLMDYQLRSQGSMKYVEDLSNAKPGDMIEFVRNGYSHWAIYKGEGKVIHRWGDSDGVGKSIGFFGNLATFSGVQFNKAKIVESNIDDVLHFGGKVRVNNYLDGKYKPLDVSEIVKRAVNVLDHSGYNLLYNNCEHFATDCRYGESTSRQVQLLVGTMALAGVATATLLTAGMVGTCAIVKKMKKKRFQERRATMIEILEGESPEIE